jgi:hypothetical protein
VKLARRGLLQLVGAATFASALPRVTLNIVPTSAPNNRKLLDSISWGGGMRCLSFAGQGNVPQPLPVVSTAIPQLDGCPTRHESWSR